MRATVDLGDQLPALQYLGRKQCWLMIALKIGIAVLILGLFARRLDLPCSPRALDDLSLRDRGGHARRAGGINRRCDPARAGGRSGRWGGSTRAPCLPAG